LVKGHDIDAVAAVLAGVVDRHAVDAQEYSLELEVELAAGGQTAGEVIAQLLLATHRPIGHAEPLDGQRGDRDDIVCIVVDHGIEVVPVPGVDPLLGNPLGSPCGNHGRSPHSPPDTNTTIAPTPS